jgi:hypothetical protein
MSIKNKWVLVPIIFSFLISLFYIVVIPGKIKSDAAEYDGLANSILNGEYSLDGKPSMEREPGYPLFRATLKVINSSPKFILFIQLILFCLTIYFVGLISNKIDPKIGLWGLWGASLSYALAFYPSTHISETFVAFLLAIFGYILIKSTENPKTMNWIYLSILSSFIVLTKYPYIIVPISFLVVMSTSSFKQKIDKKIIIKNILVSIFIISTLTGAWLYRNYSTFNEIGFAGRSGAGFYARAWKADKTWRSIADSYISTFLGRGILYTVYPNNQSIWLDQWGDWWRDPKVVKEMWGEGMAEIDNNRKIAAKEIILKDFNNFSKFIAWSGIDTLRLLQLQNPIPTAQGSPFEGTYGELAKEKNISFIQLTGLAIVHLLQLIWFITIFVSTYIGFRKYSYRFIPGVFLISILLVHTIADNIARYGAPLQPFILSGIFMTIIYPLYEKHRNNRNNSSI